MQGLSTLSQAGEGGGEGLDGLTHPSETLTLTLSRRERGHKLVPTRSPLPTREHMVQIRSSQVMYDTHHRMWRTLTLLTTYVLLLPLSVVRAADFPSAKGTIKLHYEHAL